MKHIFQTGTNKYTLLLLHGTGGNEHDLLSLAKVINPNANILSVRGNVIEGGMPRFFKRLSEGIFDEADLILRTKELNEFIDNSSETYKFSREYVIAVGYSNGANIAGSLLFQIEKSLKGAILFHPMVPRRGIDLPNLSEVDVFIGAGTNDPLSSVDETNELASLLRAANAKVDQYWGQGGHQLTEAELLAAKAWYHSIY